MGYTKSPALKLPDQLLVRYFRGDEIEAITKVEVVTTKVTVTLKIGIKVREDKWRDLGGGLGYVPEVDVAPPSKV